MIHISLSVGRFYMDPEWEKKNYNPDVVSDEIKKYTTKEINILLKQFHGMKHWLRPVKWKNGVTSTFHADWRSMHITNMGLSGSVKEANVIHREANPTGFSVDNSYRGLLIHEFGHAVDHYIIQKSDDDGKVEWFNAKKEFLSSALKPSEYSRKNQGEHFAELFSLEILNNKTDGRGLLGLIQNFITELRTANLIK